MHLRTHVFEGEVNDGLVSMLVSMFRGISSRRGHRANDGAGFDRDMIRIEGSAPGQHGPQDARFLVGQLTADAGYHSSDNVNALCDASMPALVADNQMRQRDERYAEQAKHKAKGEVLHDKRKPAGSPNPKVKGLFTSADFIFHADNTCTCPAGCTLRSSGAVYTAGRYQRQEFTARASDCQGCKLRPQRIRKPETVLRKIAVHHRIPDDPNEPIHRMRAAIDSPRGRQLYSQRIATVEPVFGNLRHNKRPARFTLRGKDKVGAQWRLFCLVHNIEKLANRGDWA